MYESSAGVSRPQAVIPTGGYEAMGPQRIRVAQAQFGSARPGSARCDTVKRKPFWAWLGMARPVLGLPGLAQSSLAWA